MLSADAVQRLRVEKFAERRDHRVENRDTWHFEPAAAIAQLIAQRVINEGEHHRSGLFPDSVEHNLHGVLRARHWPGMFDRIDMIELNQARTRNRMDRLARRIGD